MEFTARYSKILKDLARKSRLRSLGFSSGVDFTSHDYLGLARSGLLIDPVIHALQKGTRLGAGGSRLLCGHCPEHARLEEEAATFFGAESALFFNSGYMANSAVFSTLPQRGDLLLLDAHVHASTHDGVRASRASYEIILHNDLCAFERALKKWSLNRKPKTHPWIVVESLYSMGGDRAPLEDLMALADRYHGFLVIDEAHATGIFGPSGRGLGAHLEGRENVLAIHTCSKALGVSGALLTGSQVFCDFLVNRARPFIYSTAPSPIIAVAVSHALHFLKKDSAHQERLKSLIAFAHEKLGQIKGICSFLGSPILPVIIGESTATMATAQWLQLQGLDVRGIRPPTVPEGTARLRISITLNISYRDIERLHDALAMAEETHY
jgi:8-amino-7-oxononanoate synthase